MQLSPDACGESRDQANRILGNWVPPRSAGAEADPLTAREKEGLKLLAEGQLCKEIAETLQVSVPTVCTQIRRIYEKLSTSARTRKPWRAF